MNSVESKPVLIGLDWGTSSLRAFLIGADGEVLDTTSSARGIMTVKDGDFEAVFCSLMEPWKQHGSLPVIASGMITSRNGWVETPYVTLPAGGPELAAALTRHETRESGTIHFVTGMTTDHDGAPDVMRGEETQIIGALAIGLNDSIFVMPGTHSKWVSISGQQIENYATYMTGEVFAALKAHTILGTLMQDGPFNRDGFDLGVKEGLSSGANLLHNLFHVRTMPLFGKISQDMTADYLSGMLIGAEIGAASRHVSGDRKITIVGRGDLCDRYEAALNIAGLKSSRAPDDIAARGHFVIAQSAGLLT